MEEEYTLAPVKCYVMPKAGNYYAGCIAFNLSVTGDTPAIAISNDKNIHPSSAF